MKNLKLACILIALLLMGCNSTDKQLNAQKQGFVDGVKVVGVILEQTDKGDIGKLPESTQLTSKVLLFDAKGLEILREVPVQAGDSFEIEDLDGGADYRIVVEANIVDDQGKVVQSVSGMAVLTDIKDGQFSNIYLPSKDAESTNDLMVTFTRTSVKVPGGKAKIRHIFSSRSHSIESDKSIRFRDALQCNWFYRKPHNLSIDLNGSSSVVSFTSYGLSRKSRTLFEVQ
jgi:hypothetical protein